MTNDIMHGYPVFLRLAGRKCVVVGGGPVAERKVLSMHECKAGVTVVSPEITPVIADLVVRNEVRHRQGRYKTSDIEGAFVVIAASSCKETNHKVARDCWERDILVNVVDDPVHCGFFLPSQLRRGHLTIAVSTDGQSPMFARRIREELEKEYPPGYGDFLSFITDLRNQVLDNETDGIRKSEILSEMVSDEVMQFLKKGQYDRAKEQAEHAVTRSRN